MQYSFSPTAERMLLNLQMLIDPMDELFWDYQVSSPGTKPWLRGCLLYSGQQTLQADILYILPEELAPQFPRDQYAYATPADLGGKAPHIRRVNQSFPALFNLILSVFQRYTEFEMKLNNVITSGGTLTDLCRIASDFFQNPVYIHDNLFYIIAISHYVEGMLEFEYNEKNGKQHTPLWLINEFKFDENYNDTLTLHQASIWGNDQYPHNMRSLFVNLWDGLHYCGRVLVNELNSSLQPGQFRAVEYFANYAIMLLRMIDQSQTGHYRSYEEIFVALMRGDAIDEGDLYTIMSILEWGQEDRYLCMKLQSQDPGISIRSDSAMNSVLAQLLDAYISFQYDRQLCVVVNLTHSRQSAPAIRQSLAPYIRDALMYTGISSPIPGIKAIGMGFAQTDIVLEHIHREDNSNWIRSFASCALSYIHSQATQTMPTRLLVHPMLPELLEHDRENGTQYYETLRVWLNCERSIPQTSAALIIHRTTLTYRLGKIQELIRINLDDPVERLYLSFSYYVMERYGTGCGTGPLSK